MLCTASIHKYAAVDNVCSKPGFSGPHVSSQSLRHTHLHQIHRGRFHQGLLKATTTIPFIIVTMPWLLVGSICKPWRAACL